MHLTKNIFFISIAIFLVPFHLRAGDGDTVEVGVVIVQEDNSTQVKLQTELISQLARVNWNNDGDQEYLFRSIEGLKNIKPATPEIQNKRIGALSKALLSQYPNVRNAAGDALIGIARTEQDPHTQKLILSNANVNWNYDGDQGYLFRMIEAANVMRPASDQVAQERVGYLGKAQKASWANVRNAASLVLCSVSGCNVSQGEQDKIVKEFSKVNWNYDQDQKYLFKSIEGLRGMKPLTSEIQSQRIKALSAALLSQYANVRNAAGDALVAIAQTEQDAHTQGLILSNAKVNWNYDQNQDYLFKMIKAAEAMRPASDEIASQRLHYLGAAQKSQFANVRKSSSLVLCGISKCDLPTEDQAILAKELARVNWNYDGDQEYLFRSIEGLKNIKPATPVIQNERIGALSKALLSQYPNVRNAAGDALIGIARTEQDPHTQKLILSKVNVNWNYDQDQGYLFKIIEAAEAIRPANDEVALQRVKFLGAAQKSEFSNIRQSASDALLRIASSPEVKEPKIDCVGVIARLHL